MHALSDETAPSQSPPILDVIGNYVDLRQSGREFWGLCPFHSEKTGSFAVNPAKEVFYCHGCHLGGDAIEFVKRIEGVDFKTAAKRLGVQSYRPSPEQLQIRRKAKNIAQWAVTTSRKICDALRDIGDQIRVCKLARQQSGISPELAEHEASLIRRWVILCDLDDDLHQSTLAVELWEQRAEIDALVESLA